MVFRPSRRSFLPASAATTVASPPRALGAALADDNPGRASSTDATYYNDASQNAADPYVLYDTASTNRLTLRRGRRCPAVPCL